MEFTTKELSFVCFVFVNVFSGSMLLVVFKQSFIDGTVCLLYYSFSLFLTMHKIALILCILFEILKFTVTMKLVLMKSPFIFRNSFEQIRPRAFFDSIAECTFILQSILGLKSSFFKLIFPKLPSKFISICKLKLTILAMLFAIEHSTTKFRSIIVQHISLSELPICKYAFKRSIISLSPNTFPMWLRIFIKKALVVISVFEDEFSFEAFSFFELALKIGLIRCIKHLPFPMWPSQIIAFTFITSLFIAILLLLRRLCCLWLLTWILSHQQIDKQMNIKISVLFLIGRIR